MGRGWKHFFGNYAECQRLVSSTPADAAPGKAELNFSSGGDGEATATTKAAPVPAADTGVPAESLYETYFPADVRNLAPHIEIVYENDPVKDKVGVSMQEVEYDGTEAYFPKEYSGMAPFIDIQYTRNLATAKVGVRMGMVTPLPAPAPPVACEINCPRLSHRGPAR